MRKWIPTLIFTALLTLILGCNGTTSSTPEAELVSPAAHPAPPPSRSIALADLELEIRGASPPPGVDTEVYDQLKEELVRVLRARGISKLVATPPLGEINKITDLKLYGTETGVFRLEWTYVNAGDLNLDGLVSINDLTAIGLHFESVVDGENWIAACRADGNRAG